MIQRRVVVPAGVDRLWRALTDPDEAGRWLGGRLDWDPEEGRSLTFAPRGGGAREGRVEEVVPGRYMRFVWWPADDGPDGASEVAYRLEPVIPGPGSEAEEATILTVEEAPVGAPATASASASTVGELAGCWTMRDEVMWRSFSARQAAGALVR